MALTPVSGSTSPLATIDHMEKSVYDPTDVEGDVFDMDNMAEGASLILSAAERSKLSGIEAAADVTDAVNIASSIVGVADKATPVNADTVGLIDSAAGSVLKELTWANIKATLKTYFDTLYTPVGLANYANDITNGQYRVTQAGPLFIAPADGVYDLDGWLIGKVGTAVFDIKQDVGSSAGKKARLSTVTTADVAFAAGDYVEHITRIEGYDAVKYLGNTFTVSFKVRSAVTGTHCFAIFDGTHTKVKEYTINVANTLEYKSLTFIGGMIALSSSINASGMELRWSNGHGSALTTTADAWNTGNFIGTANQVNDVATNGNVFGLEDVTMNLGTAVVPDTRDIEQDKAKCKRYYNRIVAGADYTAFASGFAFSATEATVALLYPEMRVPPSILQSNTGINDPSERAVTSLGGAFIGTQSAFVALIIGGGGMTAGQGLVWNANINSSAFVELKARL